MGERFKIMINYILSYTEGQWLCGIFSPKAAKGCPLPGWRPFFTFSCFHLSKEMV